MQGGGYDQGFHELRMKSTRFHVDFMKSGRFHVKSKDLLQGIVTLCLLTLLSNVVVWQFLEVNFGLEKLSKT